MRNARMIIQGATLLALLWWPRHLGGQTFVQLPDLDPSNSLGPRLTRVVVWNKLSRALFGEIAAKVTLVSAEGSQPTVYEFAADGVWNRVVFGEKDIYINAFDDRSSTTQRLFGPAGVDISASRILYIADRYNERVVLARFDPLARSLSEVGVAQGDSALVGVIDIAWDGGVEPFLNNYFYALSDRGIVVLVAMDHGCSNTPVVVRHQGHINGPISFPERTVPWA